jgi:hypothetical protein
MTLVTTEPAAPLLRQFMELLEATKAQYPNERRILRISRVALMDWRKLKQSDWGAEGWGNDEDEDLTSLDRSRDVYLRALKKRLSPLGVSNVEVVNDPYMEVILDLDIDEV